MRIQITGDGSAANTLRRYLASLGYTLTGIAPAYTIRVEQGGQSNVVLEGVRGPLAEETQHAVAELAGAPIEWRSVKSGNDRQLKVWTNGVSDDAVERGVLRAVLRITGHGQQSGWRRLLRPRK